MTKRPNELKTRVAIGKTTLIETAGMYYINTFGAIDTPEMLWYERPLMKLVGVPSSAASLRRPVAL
jgi:hypothetical protein